MLRLDFVIAMLSGRAPIVLPALEPGAGALQAPAMLSRRRRAPA